VRPKWSASSLPPHSEARLTIWDPAVVARLSALELHARTLVLGYRSGGHRSRRVSSNIEFADYKPYTPGDPLRDLDWRIAARSDRLVVRRHHAEEELAINLVVDASADMGTGTSGRYPFQGLDGSKWSTAAVLAATLAQFGSLRGDPVGLSVLGGENVRWSWLPPGGGSAQVARIHRVLSETRPAGKANLRDALMALGHRLRRNSLVVVVSDLMEPPADWGPALDAFGERKCDVRVVHVHDPLEWSFTLGNVGRFFSPEGGLPVDADPLDVAEQMPEVVAAYLAEVRSWLARCRGMHVLAPSSDDLGGVVARLLRGV